MKKIITILLFFTHSLYASGQFVTIMGETETIQNDSTGIDYAMMKGAINEDEGNDDDDPEKENRKRGIKVLFKKIGNWLGLKNKETPQDTVPTDPALYSYDEIENKGLFLFTEADEKRYLDSIKYELIKRRQQVLRRKMMVSMPMEELTITSYFGYRNDPITHTVKFHNGIDFAAHDCFVSAVLPGVVAYAGYRGGYGYCVELVHGEVHTLYAHLSYILVKKNQPIPAGEPIGISGTTGRSTGEHLHFSVLNKGRFIDPLPMLDYLSSILAEVEPMEEEYYMPNYTELKNAGKDRWITEKKTEPADSLRTEEKVRSDETAFQRKTSGTMLLPKDNHEVVEGKIYTHGNSGANSEMIKGETPTFRIINYSGKKNETATRPGNDKEGLSTQNKGTGNGYRLVPDEESSRKAIKHKAIPKEQLKSGILLPPGDSSKPVKPQRKH